MPFQKILIILNSIDINRTQSTDLLLDLSYLLFHFRQIGQLLLSVGKGIVGSDLILLPHIGNTFFPALLQLIHLAFQAETLFVQKADLAGKLISFFKKFFMLSVSLLFLLLPFLQLQLCLLRLDAGIGSFCFQLLDRQFLLLHLLTAVGKRFINTFLLILQSLGLRIQTVQVFLVKLVLLIQRRSLKTDFLQLSGKRCLFFLPLIQLCLFLLYEALQLLFILAGAFQFLGNLLMILTDFQHLASDLFLVSVDLLIASTNFLCFLFLLGNIHLCSILFYILLAKLVLKICNGIPKYISPVSVVFHCLLDHGNL